MLTVSERRQLCAGMLALLAGLWIAVHDPHSATVREGEPIDVEWVAP
jgi:hypothetical protein